MSAFLHSIQDRMKQFIILTIQVYLDEENFMTLLQKYVIVL
jgi:hypothetical protein